MTEGIKNIISGAIDIGGTRKKKKKKEENVYACK